MEKTTGRSRRGRPRLMAPRERHERLLDSATRLFAETGYEATTVDAICAAADVAKPSAYELFPSKTALYEAAVERALVEMTGHLLEVWASPDAEHPRERTLARVEAVFRFAEERPDPFALLIDAWRRSPPGTGRTLEQAKAGMTERLAALLASELPPGGRRDLASEVLAVASLEATMAVALRVYEQGEWPSAETAELLAGFLYAGLGSVSS